jgi:hypothetical protein
MGWIIVIVALSSVMTVLTISELRRPVSATSTKIMNLTIADCVIAVFVLGTFTFAIINGLILVAAKTLP